MNHLKQGAPNGLIILMDNVGFGTPDTFGGPVHTPTFTRIYSEGIVHNRFSHYVDLFADACCSADGPEPSSLRRLEEWDRLRLFLRISYRRDIAVRAAAL